MHCGIPSKPFPSKRKPIMYFLSTSTIPLSLVPGKGNFAPRPNSQSAPSNLIFAGTTSSVFAHAIRIKPKCNFTETAKVSTSPTNQEPESLSRKDMLRGSSTDQQCIDSRKDLIDPDRIGRQEGREISSAASSTARRLI